MNHNHFLIIQRKIVIQFNYKMLELKKSLKIYYSGKNLQSLFSQNLDLRYFRFIFEKYILLLKKK